MQVLYLTESDVERLLTMQMALDAVEAAFHRQAVGQVRNNPRQRLPVPAGAMLHYMAASDAGLGYFGMKIYSSSRSGVQFMVPLYQADTGALVSLLEADHLGCVRTGAASGVATKHIARPDASRVGIIGSGHQASAQLLAVSVVRKLSGACVYSPTREHREAFAGSMEAQLPLAVRPVETAEEAVRESDIVITITSSREPVVRGAWLAPGTHINAAGVNSSRRRELDEEAVSRCDRVVVDSLEQSKQEAGDLIAAFHQRSERWEQVRTLAEVVGGEYPGRESPDEITLFKSNGVALEDVSVAALVYERALAEGVGRRLPMWEPEQT
jgi:ornithine cyclodeaminase/alanine dehydrogenase-like protein (mu-crystallin family)